MTSKELFEKFKRIGASWEIGHQVGYRLRWLKALKLVEDIVLLKMEGGLPRAWESPLLRKNYPQKK